MAVRSSMAALITRTRLLINDPAGTAQQFADQDVQDILDESRRDEYNVSLEPKWSYSGGTIVYLTYAAPYGNWETDYVLKQYLTVVVTASVAEVIPGIFTFAASTYPPVFVTGKTYDCYRAAADLLERWAARYMTRFDFSSDGQSFKVSQAPAQMVKLAATYRQKQRVGTIVANRSDLALSGEGAKPSLDAKPVDYYASG